MLEAVLAPFKQSPAELQEELTAFGAVGGFIALDMETAMAPVCFQGRKQVRLLQLYTPTKSRAYDLQTWSSEMWEVLRLWLSRRDLIFVGHNLAFDFRCLLGCGCPIAGQLRDTLVFSQLLYNGQAWALKKGALTLAACCKRVLGQNLDKTMQTADWMNLDLTTNRPALEYAMADVRYTYQLADELHGQVLAAGLGPVMRLECETIKSTVMMEQAGFPVNRDHLDQVITDLASDSQEAQGYFIESLDNDLDGGLPRWNGEINLRPKSSGRGDKKVPAGFNYNSPVQVLRYFQQIGIEPHTPNGWPTVDQKALGKFKTNPTVAAYISYRKAEKRLSMMKALNSVVDADTSRVYPRFNQLRTGTGRYSCSSPNCQQIPREPYIRNCFSAPEGRSLVVMDVKNMEMAVAASERIANEQNIQEALRTGRDIHTFTASKIFSVAEDDVTKDQRQKAKTINFGLLYGAGAQGLINYFEAFGQFITRREAEFFREAWLSAYPAFSLWHSFCRGQALERQVRMVDGRLRALEPPLDKHTVVANNIVQGTSASIVKLTMNRVRENLPDRAFLFGQAHDEILVECCEGDGGFCLALMKSELRDAGVEILGSSVEMVGEGAVVRSWGDAK